MGSTAREASFSISRRFISSLIFEQEESETSLRLALQATMLLAYSIMIIMYRLRKSSKSWPGEAGAQEYSTDDRGAG
jgi:hypothetical protein